MCFAKANRVLYYCNGLIGILRADAGLQCLQYIYTILLGPCVPTGFDWDLYVLDTFPDIHVYVADSLGFVLVHWHRHGFTRVSALCAVLYTFAAVYMTLGGFVGVDRV